MWFCGVLVIPVFWVTYLNSEWTAIALLCLATAAHQGFSANLLTRRLTCSTHGGRLVAGLRHARLVGASCWLTLQAIFSNLLKLCEPVRNRRKRVCVSLVIMFLLAPGLKKVESIA